jgi:uncharacterized protein (TIGR03086 family)
VLGEVTDAQLTAATPCAAWAVEDLLVHVIGGNRRVAGSSGETAPPTSADEARRSYEESAAAVQATFEDPATASRIFTVPFGEVPGSFVLQLRTIDTLTHAWDLARATGQGTDLDPQLAADALAASQRAIRPELRGEGRPFGPQQQPPKGATAADELAAFLGRIISQG